MKRSFALALVATLTFLATACGDDDTSTATDGESSEDSTTTAPADEGSGGGEQAADDGDFCATFQELLAGEPTPAQLRDLAEIAPDAGKEPIETITAQMEADPENYFGTEEFSTAFAALGSVGVDECADDAIDVTAEEYQFAGFPEEVSAGTLGVNLSNDGKEVHELIIVRKNDDTTESFDEIFAMEDEAAALALVTEAGFSFAAPGTSTGGLYDVSEPGEYAAVCFIPTGTTSFATEVDGPPHFAQGMMTTFTVG